MTSDTTDHARRAAILREHGARGGVVSALLAYAESSFDEGALLAGRRYPLADEPFVEAWRACARSAVARGAVEALRDTLVQLRFPVEAGMSERPAYQEATRRGVLPPDTIEPARFADPDGVTVTLHPTAAGRLPVVTCTARSDFELLVRAVTRRNEPQPLPQSMGACIVGGYNDWARIAALRATWEERARAEGLDGGEAAWMREFQRVSSVRELYQDRFVILSTGPYSGVAGAAFGLDEGQWRRESHVIRLEHECAHYFTRRVFGSMRNSLLDELIADYTGLVAARGRFEPSMLLRFMGVAGDTFDPGGRLANYRGSPPLDDEAFVILQSLVRAAAGSLDVFDRALRDGMAQRLAPRSMEEVAWSIAAIAATGLERLASPDGAGHLLATYRRQEEDALASPRVRS